MRFRSARPQPAITALLTLAVLPIAGPPAIAADTPRPPETRTVRIPLREVAMNRSGAREVRSEKPFDLVGLTWKGDAPDRIEVRVRTAEGWGAWTPLEAENGGSEPMWTGGGHDAQVRAGRQGRDITDQLQFVGIDPGQLADPPQAGPTAANVPPVVTRAQWGADESKMTWPAEPTTTRAVAVHHTAGTNDYTCAESDELVRGIYQYHAVELGWGDVGYHALVDKCGTVFEGRSGGLTGHVIGGHVRGYNRNTFGISMMGNYDAVTPSDATVGAVGEMAGWKLSTVNVPATGSTRLTSDSGTELTLPTIFGHRDAGSTACPGERGYQQLGAIRTRAADTQRTTRP